MQGLETPPISVPPCLCVRLFTRRSDVCGASEDRTQILPQVPEVGRELGLSGGIWRAAVLRSLLAHPQRRRQTSAAHRHLPLVLVLVLGLVILVLLLILLLLILPVAGSSRAGAGAGAGFGRRVRLGVRLGVGLGPPGGIGRAAVLRSLLAAGSQGAIGQPPAPPDHLLVGGDSIG
jgi:hypothetical protein